MRSTRFFRAAGLLVSVLLASSFVLPYSKQFIILKWSAKRVRDARIAAVSDPGETWNCMCVNVAEQNIGVILPNDRSGDAERIGDLLLMLEGAFEEGILDEAGQIGTWRDDGTLAGIEVRWSGGLNPFALPSASSHLGTTGELIDEAGQDLATVYCYDATQMPARVAAIEAEMGSPLTMHKVWLGPTLLSSNSGAHSMSVSGTQNRIHGDLFSRGNFKVTGDDHAGDDRVRFLGTSSLSGSGHAFPDLLQLPGSIPLPPVPSTANEYAELASAAGTNFEGDVTLKSGGSTGLVTQHGIEVDSVLYATGRIYVEGNGITGTVTMVSELGISISGDQRHLSPAHDDVLAIVLGGAIPTERLDNNILVEGRMGALEGSLWAPGGVIEVIANDTELTGRIVAEKIRIAGYGNTVTDGCQ